MATKNQHWNSIFAAKNAEQLGWYETDVSQTLKFLEQVPHIETATAFLPGAGTSLLVDEILHRVERLILNDISDEALYQLKQRTGEQTHIIWLHHDMSQPVNAELPVVDIWIDRAVLHFLLDETDIQGYFANLHAMTCQGSYVLLAEFSTSGALKCAGLELHRYSLEEMTQRMGPDFQLIHHEYYTFTNPSGDPRPYIYALFKKM